jgi:signal transduction histidine kinase/CheY-like chemotaxis protein/ligand-binding sensor domain-containing protein
LKFKFLFVILAFLHFISCKDASNHASLQDNDVSLKTKSIKLNNTKFPAAPTDLKYSLEQLDNTKGLSNSSVNCIFQDSQNLIWIGTWDGLNRYDGNNFKIFRPEPHNQKSISNQVILKIAEDRSGYIWILTMHGINRYDKKTNLFTPYYFLRDDKAPLSESEFNMALNNDKEVFCAVKEWGLGYYDGNNFVALKGINPNKKDVKKIEFSSSGKLIILSDDNSLSSLTIKTGDDGSKSIVKSDVIANDISTFSALPNDKLCIVTTNGEAYQLSINERAPKILSGTKVENIIGCIPQGVILSGKSGYTIVDGKGNKISMPWTKYLKNQKISTLVQGNENILWTGTDGDGVFKMYPLKNAFNLISKSQIPELDGGIVRSFIVTDDGSFLIGTKGKGLYKISENFLENPDQPLDYKSFNESNSSINNAVFALSRANNKLTLIGTDGEGLTVFDSATDKLIGWQEIEGAASCNYFKSVYAIHQEPDGLIYLGTNGYGMIKCRIERNGSKLKVTDFKRYLAGDVGKGMLSSNIIFSIVSGDNGKLWIGTRLGGLNLFDSSQESFTTYKNSANDNTSLSNNDILCLVKDVDNKLWIGTSFGLNVLQKIHKDGTAVFKSYVVKDGLPNNTVHGIVPIGVESLWLSTNFGLSNFNVSQNKFTNYSKSEGLQNNEFADGASYIDPASGYIFMGGIKGFNYFLPQKIKESNVLPDLFIDNISGRNQAAPYYQNLVISSESVSYPSMVLNHDQNFFDIHLAALTYTNNEKCQYAYQLKGFDKSWNNIENRKIISFTNVPRGNYSLYMKWSNADGIWTEPVHAIDIRIKPVWWQSNLAMIIYVALAVLFILFLRSYYLKRQSLKQNIQSRKNEEELHENRLTFFTNIAHEFLTPLTLIVGPVQKLAEASNLNEKNQKFITMIQRNASRLLFLTQELLEFRKAEHDSLEIVVKKFDLTSLIEQIAELFDDWAMDKNIDYHLEVPPALPGWFDKDKIEKIIFNLMSNAFKYTPTSGRITFKCSIENNSSKTLNITITNSGKGISKEKLESLFDRFFLSDTNQTSDTDLFRTGIGLAYIKKLVTVLRGEIQVSSIPDAETKFTVLLPCGKEAFSDKEINLETAPVIISHHLKNLLEEIAVAPENVPVKISSLDAIEDYRKKILIVEDDSEIHLFLHDLLADKYRIISANNGVEALEIMAGNLPDIIISDVMMPLMDGVELCKKVKADVATCHIPFIMLTAKNTVIHRIEGLESGANSYIPKPFYPDHLLIRVRKLLEERDLILQHFSQDTLVGNLPQLPIENEDKTFIKTVIELIRANIDNENLQSAFIEKELGISTSQLYRKTKEIFSLSPGDLIRTIRLKYSAELLRKNVLTVSEICYKSGFNNRSYFYREFKKVYNATPKNYQLQYKPKVVPFSNN